MSTTIYFASNVTRVLDRADAALVFATPPKLAFRVDQSGLRPVPGAAQFSNMSHDSFRYVWSGCQEQADAVTRQDRPQMLV